ncbi:MAG TPA: hypothetical protein PKA41_04495 [Verrucomicrobiota bacterium]|nr:hypothetical protein [Verrucomicrobiota bacterium]
MKRSKRRQEKDALDLIEEAIHRLRTESASALSAYYLGSLPFVLGFLFFWADMARNPFAPARVAEASLIVAALFVWMKFWQAVFALRLRAWICGQPQPPLRLAQCRGILVSQLALQPTGLFILPLAAIPALPLAWVYAFYQNVTVFADSGNDSLRGCFDKARRQAMLWPRQNHILLAYMSLFGFFVFLNLGITGAFIPYLLKMLLGIESVFTRGGLHSIFNTTFLTALVGLTYLCVDPILKTIYALRCFYGESLQSGEDLKTELKLHSLPAQRIAALLLAVLLLGGATTTVHADDTAPAAVPAQSPSSSAISPADLDRAINETIQERKYLWRLPRDQAEQLDNEDGIIAGFFKKVEETLRNWVKAVLNWLDDWLRKLFKRKSGGNDSGGSWLWTLDFLLYALLAIVLSLAAVLLIRWWRNRYRTPETVQAQAIQPVPDVSDENVGADQLPEDGWTKLARELLARGELRLALRAFYLASLANLAEKNLISLARFKSNRDYELELRRRAHALPQLLPPFSENVSVFDRSWYGMHEVNGELIERFASNVERIKTAQ